LKIPPSELANSIREPAWYAVQVRSRKESSIASQLENRGIECFLPKFSRSFLDIYFAAFILTIGGRCF